VDITLVFVQSQLKMWQRLIYWQPRACVRHHCFEYAQDRPGSALNVTAFL
jgi:hypothetical protein